MIPAMMTEPFNYVDAAKGTKKTQNENGLFCVFLPFADEHSASSRVITRGDQLAFLPYRLRISRTLSTGSASTVRPFPVTVVALNSEFIIASSVASMTA